MMGMLTCLATVIYLEARGESFEGQIAVAQVVINRSEHEDFPNEVCEVVRQPRQFAYENVSYSELQQAGSFRAATEALLSDDMTMGATYFHSGREPYWTDEFDLTLVVGGHKFYKDNG